MGKCTGYTTTINHQYDMACGFERAMIFKNNDDQPMDLWVMLIDLLRWTHRKFRISSADFSQENIVLICFNHFVSVSSPQLCLWTCLWTLPQNWLVKTPGADELPLLLPTFFGRDMTYSVSNEREAAANSSDWPGPSDWPSRRPRCWHLNGFFKGCCWPKV